MAVELREHCADLEVELALVSVLVELVANDAFVAGSVHVFGGRVDGKSTAALSKRRVLAVVNGLDFDC